MRLQKFLKKIFAFLPTFFSPHSLYIQKGRKNGAQFKSRRYYNYKGVIIMKNITIKLASIAMASLMSLSAMTTLAADASAQWVETDCKYTYTDDETDKILTGWQDIDGSRYYLGKNGVILILIFNQPIDKFDSYNAATRRQAPLPGGKPACGRFPRLAAFYLPPLSTERLKISISSKKEMLRKRNISFCYLIIS